VQAQQKDEPHDGLAADEEEEKVPLSTLVELALDKSRGSFQRVLELVAKLQLSPHYLGDNNSILHFLKTQLHFDEDCVREGLESLTQANKPFASKVLSVLVYSMGPMHVETLQKILLQDSSYKDTDIGEALVLLQDAFNTSNSNIARVNPKATF